VSLLDEADELRRRREQADRRTADLIPALFYDMFGDPVMNLRKWPRSTFEEQLILLEYGPRFYNEPYSPTGIRIVRITDLDTRGILCFESMPKLTVPRVVRSARCLRAGDLIFARTGATVGKTALIRPGDPECIAGAYFIRLHFRESIDPLYAKTFLDCRPIQSIIRTQSIQSAQQNFSGPGIRGLPLLVPPLEAQREFAFRATEIRALEARQAESRRRLDDLFQSLLHRAFQGEL
jgi:type I restriction enzyme S subunit